jgi:phosphate transport system permease protein
LNHRGVTPGPKTSVPKQLKLKKVRRPHEKFIILLLFLAASLAVIVSIAIIYTLVEGSYNFFTNPKVNIVEFLTGTQWIPSGGDPKFGILPLVAGTGLITIGAVLIGAPLGVGAALYLSEFAGRRVRAVAKPIIEVLAGIPSIVYGFFALMVISPFFRDLGASYFNAISAIIVMAIMILPIIVSISDDAMKAVPNHLREASYAMGATKWETSVKVVLPAASSGITASILLGVARAIGETMVVTLAAGSVANLTWNPFEEVMTMTAYIAQVATGDIPPGVAYDAAFAVGLVLFIMTYFVNYIAGRVVLRILAGERGSLSKKKPGAWFLGFYFIKVAKYLKKKILKISIKKRAQKPQIFAKRKLTSEEHLKRRYYKAKIGITASAICLIIAAGFLLYLLGTVLIQGLGAIDWQFLTYFPSYRPEKAGIYPVILGSVYLMLLTLLFAVYLTEIAPDKRSTRFLRSIIQNLAGVPSIVFGLVGLMVFVRLFNFGPSLLAGSLTLAIMVLPIIVVSTEEALKSVPQSFREAALGMGATKWQAVRHHVIPNAVPGILTGSILALSRAIGETAPILFIGAVFAKSAPSSVFDNFLALPMTIFYWTRHPKEEFHELAAATIIVLLIILFSMNLIAIIIRHRAQARRDW